MICLCPFPFIVFPLVMLLPDMYFHIRAFNQSNFLYPLLPGRVKVKEAFTICSAGPLTRNQCLHFNQSDFNLVSQGPSSRRRQRYSIQTH